MATRRLGTGMTILSRSSSSAQNARSVITILPATPGRLLKIEPVKTLSSVPQFCPDIPLDQIRIGDYVEARVDRKDGKVMLTLRRKGEVKEIHGRILRIKTRMSKHLEPVLISQVIKAWGER